MDAVVQFLPYVAIFAVFWLLLIRPQQKRAREQQERQESLTAGTRVMTTAGIFGTVQHVGKSQVVLEIAPGVEMTVIKGAIAKTVSADEDEFEYEDAASAAPLGAAALAADPMPVDAPATDAMRHDDARFDDAIAGYHAESAPDPLAAPDPSTTQGGYFSNLPGQPGAASFDPTRPSEDDPDADGRPGATKA